MSEPSPLPPQGPLQPRDAKGSLGAKDPIRVVLVDDHPMVRMGLRLLLRSSEQVAVVGEAEDGEEALRLCAQVQPDVVLMDLRLPRLDGVATTRALRSQSSQSSQSSQEQRQEHEPTPRAPRVLVLTASYDAGLIPAALAAGASGYVLKGGSVEELVAAIQSAHARP
jgi:DNA-binding NarL/FixJ family response regulator